MTSKSETYEKIHILARDLKENIRWMKCDMQDITPADTAAFHMFMHALESVKIMAEDMKTVSECSE